VDASILLLTKNAGSDLAALLASVQSQKTSFKIEILAIDSGSTDGTVELLTNFAVPVWRIPAEQFHHARTRNFAATLAEGRFLVFLSQDAIPADDRWLTTLLANFDDPQVGAVYGRQLPKSGSSLERRDLFDTIYGEKKVVKDPTRRNGMGYRFYHFSNVNAALRRSVWEEVRFPEDLKVFEDLGIAKGILDGGWKIVYEPKAAVFHSHTHSTIGLLKRYFDIGYTLRLLRIWDAPETRGSLVRDGWRLLRAKFRRIGDKEKSTLARKGIGQDLAKSLGMFLGLNQSCLPLALKRRLSAFRVFG
jgi:rhamnosyltransferase